jgi:hypothetical protein
VNTTPAAQAALDAVINALAAAGEDIVQVNARLVDPRQTGFRYGFSARVTRHGDVDVGYLTWGTAEATRRHNALGRARTALEAAGFTVVGTDALLVTRAHRLSVAMTGDALEAHVQADIDAGGTGWLPMPAVGPFAPVSVGDKVKITVADAEPDSYYDGFVADITGPGAATACVQLD